MKYHNDVLSSELQNSPKFVRAVKKRKRNVFYIIQQTSKQFTTNNYITAELCKLKQFKRLSTNFKAFWKNFGQIKILPTSLQILSCLHSYFLCACAITLLLFNFEYIFATLFSLHFRRKFWPNQNFTNIFANFWGIFC